MDFRVCGKYENRFRNDDTGTEVGWVGQFRQNEMQRKIVQNEKHFLNQSEEDTGNATVIPITFDETEEVITIAKLIEYESKAARDAALATGMSSSMEMGYSRIDDILASLRNTAVGQPALIWCDLKLASV